MGIVRLVRFLGLMVLAGSLVACGIAQTVPSTTGAGEGLLTGQAFACQGSPTRQPLMVTVYVYRSSALITSEHLRSGSRYVFLLPPGEFTVSSPPTGDGRSLKVAITAGKTAHATIPNPCV